jgi:hypothetical protein
MSTTPIGNLVFNNTNEFLVCSRIRHSLKNQTSPYPRPRLKGKARLGRGRKVVIRDKFLPCFNFNAYGLQT